MPPPDEKAIARSFAVHFLGLAGAFVGLLARGYKMHWGIWFTIGGWSTFFLGFVIRLWVKRWFEKLRE